MSPDVTRRLKWCCFYQHTSVLSNSVNTCIYLFYWLEYEISHPVRISPAIEVTTERTTTTTARPMPPIVTRTPVTTTEGDAEPPPVVAEKAGQCSH